MQSVSITTNVVSSNPVQARCTRYNIMWCLSVTCGRSVVPFSPDTPVSSTNKTDRHNITENILLKVALNTITLTLYKYSWKISFLKPIKIKIYQPDTESSLYEGANTRYKEDSTNKLTESYAILGYTQCFIQDKGNCYSGTKGCQVLL